MNFLALFELLLTIILFSHLFACAWSILHRFEKTIFIDQQTWMDNSKFIVDSILQKYIMSYYFSIITMCTVGYGDITPVNLTE